jgi:hypothetical protein
MVTTHYFFNKVPLMRCVAGWLCQFGLAGQASALFAKKIKDDKQWLVQPAASAAEENGSSSVKMFARGYFAYAGGGPNTRGRQLFVALADSSTLGAGGPWEVPWGELVGKHSFETLANIYTGYGEQGPDQDALTKEGAHEMIAKDFPLLDYIISCAVVDEA